MWDLLFYGVIIIFALIFLSGSIKIVRPTQRALIERLGKYNRFGRKGLNFTIPFLESIIRVDVTEQMVDADEQEVITKDRLNAKVDAQVYYKIKETEEGLKASQYNVSNVDVQMVALAQTTLRNIMGELNYEKANSNRGEINSRLMETLLKETKDWGVNIVRTEIKEIRPPKDVQTSMNKVIMAENDKQEAIDLATAAETKADGERRAAIKKAEGFKKSAILKAEGEAKAIEAVANANAKKYKVENDALVKHFVKAAQTYKQLDVTEKSLKRGTKYVIDRQTGITNVISDVAGITPVERKGKG